jgi:hypothetical protein
MAPKEAGQPVSEATKRARNSKRKGASHEKDIENNLRSRGYDVERLHLNGQEDEGDLIVRAGNGDRWVLEAKNEQRISLPSYLTELATEVKNFGNHRAHLDKSTIKGAVIVKQRGKGVEHSYVVMPYDSFFGLVVAA